MSLYHFENYDSQEIFLSKSKSVQIYKQCDGCCNFYTDGILWKDACVSSNLSNKSICSKKSLFPPKNT
jgi:hypothetical protein